MCRSLILCSPHECGAKLLRCKLLCMNNEIRKPARNISFSVVWGFEAPFVHAEAFARKLHLVRFLKMYLSLTCGELVRHQPFLQQSSESSSTLLRLSRVAATAVGSTLQHGSYCNIETETSRLISKLSVATDMTASSACSAT